jgi:RimJ/RimL family protein N-acetyltransferase
MPPLETPRLLVRALQPADELDVRRLIVALSPGDAGEADWAQRYFAFSQLADGVQERLRQPPLCDRGIFLREGGELAGFVGFVAVMAPWSQLNGPPGAMTLELGLYWALHPDRRGIGLATEAAAAMIDFAFSGLHAARVVATTTRDNRASIAVMRRLGMTIHENPHATPRWFQVAGIRNDGTAPGTSSPPA